MAAIDLLRKQWKEEAVYRPFHPYLHIDDDGLTLGAGTRLAPMIEDGAGASVLALSGQEERILALLSLAYRKRISIKVIEFIKRASLRWRNGEQALAHFELAYAQLPRFANRDEARHLFYAEGLLSVGVLPRALMRSHDLDPRELDLLKYSADQPRVPAGYGRESGEWTSGASGQQYAQMKPRNPNLPYQMLPVGGNEGGGGGWTTAGTEPDIQTVPSQYIEQRIAELQEAIPAPQKGRITMAVAVVEDSDGQRFVLLSTSEPGGYLRPGVTLKPSEIFVGGTGHAEADIVDYAKSNSFRIIDIGATRPICTNCQDKIGPTGAHISTPLNTRQR